MHIRAWLGKWLQANWIWLGGVLLSVVLTFFSYPPHALGPLMFVGLAPVFMAMDTAESWRQAAFRTWVYVFLGNAAICGWVAYSLHNFAETPVILGYPAVLVLSVAEQASWPVLAGLRFVLHRRFGRRPLLWTPAALLFLDVVCPKFFPSTMGNVFYRIPWLCQLADLTGVWGLTALLALTNELAAAVLLALAARRPGLGVPARALWERRQLARHAVVSLALLGGAFAYGIWRYGEVRQRMRHPDSTLRVTIVQSNINAALRVRHAPENARGLERRNIFSEMNRLTAKATHLLPELVVWPETSYPDTYHGETPFEDRSVTALLDGMITANRLNLVFGARDQIDDDRYNSLFYISPDAAKPGAVRRQVYHKTMLLELAEHFPLSDWIPGLAPLVRQAGGTAFASGSGPITLDGPRGIALGPMICLEGLYARFVRAMVDAGATVLVNITNDAWFGDTMEPDLHLYLTAFRSIETRRPLIRATNTGYSAVVDIDGSLRFKSDLGLQEILDDEVPIYPAVRTPFMVIGDSFIALCGLYALGFPAWLAFRSRRRRAPG